MADGVEDRSKLGEQAVHHAQEMAAQAPGQFYQAQIDESTLRAPADGVIHDRRPGRCRSTACTRKQGDELFTFQATDKNGHSRCRAELSVAENDIQEVLQYGQRRRRQTGDKLTAQREISRLPSTASSRLAEPKEGEQRL